MADYITKIQTVDGNKQIDYKALANLPTSLPASDVPSWAKKSAPDSTLTKTGEAADAKAVKNQIDIILNKISDLGLYVSNGILMDKWEEI